MKKSVIEKIRVDGRTKKRKLFWNTPINFTVEADTIGVGVVGGKPVTNRVWPHPESERIWVKYQIGRHKQILEMLETYAEAKFGDRFL